MIGSKKHLLRLFGVMLLLVLVLGAVGAEAQGNTPQNPIPVDISHRLKDRPAPAQPTAQEAAAAVAASPTTAPQCGGDGETLTITVTSFDPANPGSQDVVFWNESTGGSATLWVAWDFLATAYGREDVITCEMLDYLQGTMDSIVDTNVYYFGDYVERPAGNQNIDVMIYNIVDESYFDPDFPFYIAGFFWASVNETFNRNMVFVDSYDWPNRLGPNDSPWRGPDPNLWVPNTYEGTVAHELEHLIHYDHDADEESWVDEGMADLAEYLNGYGHPDGHVVYALAFHRTPLTIWGGGLEDYGVSYLFQLYLLENFGTNDGSSFTGWNNTWTRKLIDEQANSIAGVEAATGAAFNDLYDAWMVANYLDDPSQDGAGSFPIGYDEIDLAPYVSARYGPWSIERAITDIYGSDHHGNLPIDRYYGGYVSGTVEYPLGAVGPYTPIYGTYKGIQPEMNIYLRGDAQSGVAPNSGDYEAASGGGNLLADRMLALKTPVGGTLTFWTWFDIEEEWDYGFVEASTDGGTTWTPLAGSITRDSNNPNSSTAWANSLVSGQASTDTAITGSSDGWVEATFELPAASDVLVRFSYYTDEAVNGQGWFIDDVAVDGFSDGFEDGSANWDLGGWTVTTGLFDNDWIAGYVNPTYGRRKALSLDWDYLDGTPGETSEIITGVVDTSRLRREAAVVFFANRPGENPFDSGYLLLVDKGSAN
jgi:hypothetical protein